jgi:hypothetical protein
MSHLRQLKALDGLITNDKFCWIRQSRLKLSWNKAQLRQAAEFSKTAKSPQALEGTVLLEVTNEAAMDDQATAQGNPGRAKTLEPSLSNSPESGIPERKGSRRNCTRNSSSKGESR